MRYRVRYEYGVWTVRTLKGWLLGSGSGIPEACIRARKQVRLLHGTGWLND